MSETDYSAYVGRTRERSGLICASDVEKLAAVFNRPTLPERLPPAWHWAALTEAVRQDEIGEDGHPRRGGFLPPIDLPRRMFAGATLTFAGPVEVGAQTVLRETIKSISEKAGRTGRLAFVEVERALIQKDETRVREVQSIVYREAATAPTAVPQAAPRDPALVFDWRDEISPDPVLLFRFSAVTFNSHRIHYDRDYAREAEFYPGLVVHGPLIALSLLEAFHRRFEGARVASFEFRALSPLFDLHPFWVCGRREGEGVTLWAEGPSGEKAMQASLRLGAP